MSETRGAGVRNIDYSHGSGVHPVDSGRGSGNGISSNRVAFMFSPVMILPGKEKRKRLNPFAILAALLVLILVGVIVIFIVLETRHGDFSIYPGQSLSLYPNPTFVGKVHFDDMHGIAEAHVMDGDAPFQEKHVEWKESWPKTTIARNGYFYFAFGLTCGSKLGVKWTTLSSVDISVAIVRGLDRYNDWKSGDVTTFAYFATGPSWEFEYSSVPMDDVYFVLFDNLAVNPQVYVNISFDIDYVPFDFGAQKDYCGGGRDCDVKVSEDAHHVYILNPVTSGQVLHIKYRYADKVIWIVLFSLIIFVVPGLLIVSVMGHFVSQFFIQRKRKRAILDATASPYAPLEPDAGPVAPEYVPEDYVDEDEV